MVSNNFNKVIGRCCTEVKTYLICWQVRKIYSSTYNTIDKVDKLSYNMTTE